jgi:hypothetical protein
MIVFVYGVQADFIAKYKMGDEVYTFYYKDDAHRKLRSEGDICKNGELYGIGKKFYSVSFSNGHLVVMNLGKLKSFMDMMGAQNEIESEDVQTIADEYDIKKTGEVKKIGDIKAYKWILTAKDGSGERITVYVTNDQNAKKVTNSMISMFGAFAPDMDANAMEIEKGYVVVIGDGMELFNLKKISLPASTYKLPSKHSRVVKLCRKRAQQNSSKQRNNAQAQTPPNISDEEIQKAADMFKALF